MRCNLLKLIALTLLLTGCTNIRISTNIGDWVETGLGANNVETYTFEELMSYNHKYLASFNEEHCQTDVIANQPSFKQLEWQLQSRAQQIGGNAIVLDPCESLDNYSGCTTLLRCHATAYIIDFDGV